MERKLKKLRGYNIDIITYNDAIKLISEKITDRKGMHIITINPEIIEQAEKNAELSEILKNADLVVADGIGIKIALKLKRVNQERIAGVDLAKDILKICAKSNFSAALIGAKEEVINKASENLINETDNLNICYKHNGYFNIDEEVQIINELKEKNPNVVLIALGSPKQDFFIKKCKEVMPESIFIGIGGAFDVWAGTVKRAPEFIQKIGCEWLYRTIKQPERLKRIYKTLPIFLFKAIIESISDR